MKRIIMLAIAAISAIACFGHRPPPMMHNRNYGFHHRMPPPPPRHHYIHNRHTWPAFGVGAVIGAIAATSIQPVWVPPMYQAVPVYDAYGNIVRYDQVLIRAGYWR